DSGPAANLQKQIRPANHRRLRRTLREKAPPDRELRRAAGVEAKRSPQSSALEQFSIECSATSPAALRRESSAATESRPTLAEHAIAKRSSRSCKLGEFLLSACQPGCVPALALGAPLRRLRSDPSHPSVLDRPRISKSKFAGWPG